MNHIAHALALAILIATTVSGQTPARVDGGGGARTTAQTRPPDNRRPRGTAVALLGWKAGIRSDAFGAIPFADAAAKIDAAGVAFVEGVSTNLDYKLGAEELASVKSRLAELGLRVPAYRIDSIPADEASRRKLLDFVKALEIELILTPSAADEDLPGVNVAVEDARGVYKQGAKTLGANLARRRQGRAASARAEQAAAARASRMAEQVRRLRNVAPIRQAAVLYHRSRRRRELRQGRPGRGRVSRQRDLPHAAHHDNRQNSGRRETEDRRRRSAAGAGHSRRNRESCSSSMSAPPAASTTRPSRTGT